jgi:hypothetical protein
LNQELPYVITVENSSWLSSPTGTLDLAWTVWVAKDSQKVKFTTFYDNLIFNRKLLLAREELSLTKLLEMLQ